MKLLINVGGRGTRMGELTSSIPKPMVNVAGKPLLQYLVEWAVHSGFSEIVLLCGYKYQIIREYFKNGGAFGINIHYSIESEPLGSGGPIKFAEQFIDDTFAYISGDLFCRIDFEAMLESHRGSGAIMTVLLHESTHPEDSDILKVNASGQVISFISKHKNHQNCGNLGNAGLCIIEPSLLHYMKKTKFTFETYIFPRLLCANESINSYITDELIMDVGTPERLEELQNRIII